LSGKIELSVPKRKSFLLKKGEIAQFSRNREKAILLKRELLNREVFRRLQRTPKKGGEIFLFDARSKVLNISKNSVKFGEKLNPQKHVRHKIEKKMMPRRVRPAATAYKKVQRVKDHLGANALKPPTTALSLEPVSKDNNLMPPSTTVIEPIAIEPTRIDTIEPVKIDSPITTTTIDTVKIAPINTTMIQESFTDGLADQLKTTEIIETGSIQETTIINPNILDQKAGDGTLEVKR